MFGPQKSFGFTPVHPDQRQEKVNDVFARIANQYDIMNDVMSGGLHRLWKAELLNWLDPRPKDDSGYHLLDMAGGTGDIAIRFAQRFPAPTKATLCDINADMIRVAERRISNSRLYDRINCVVGDAETLPFEDAQFDAYTIALGIRNITNVHKALSEAHRVLKPGGRFFCLEFGKVQNPLIDRLYDLYSLKVIPNLGKLITGTADPYQYLVESIRTFASQVEFEELVLDAGFGQVRYRNLSGGIAVLYSGSKLSN